VSDAVQVGKTSGRHQQGIGGDGVDARPRVDLDDHQGGRGEPDHHIERFGSDGGVQYQSVIDVLDLLGRLDITTVGLATKPLVK
jgi:hypothetical protein